MEPGGEDHDRDGERDEGEGLEGPVTDGVGDGLGGDEGGVVAFGFGDAERGGDLLEEDDDRDAEGEALDDRPGDVGQDPTEPQEARRR